MDDEYLQRLADTAIAVQEISALVKTAGDEDWRSELLRNALIGVGGGLGGGILAGVTGGKSPNIEKRIRRAALLGAILSMGGYQGYKHRDALGEALSKAVSPKAKGGGKIQDKAVPTVSEAVTDDSGAKTSGGNTTEVLPPSVGGATARRGVDWGQYFSTWNPKEHPWLSGSRIPLIPLAGASGSRIMDALTQQAFKGRPVTGMWDLYKGLTVPGTGAGHMGTVEVAPGRSVADALGATTREQQCAAAIGAQRRANRLDIGGSTPKLKVRAPATGTAGRFLDLHMPGRSSRVARYLREMTTDAMYAVEKQRIAEEALAAAEKAKQAKSMAELPPTRQPSPKSMHRTKATSVKAKQAKQAKPMAKLPPTRRPSPRSTHRTTATSVVEGVRGHRGGALKYTGGSRWARWPGSVLGVMGLETLLHQMGTPGAENWVPKFIADVTGNTSADRSRARIQDKALANQSELVGGFRK